MKLYAPSTIREIKEKYGFRLSKSLGQNFLTDKNIIDEIIEGAGIGPRDLVIEIGPGQLDGNSGGNVRRIRESAVRCPLVRTQVRKSSRKQYPVH